MYKNLRKVILSYMENYKLVSGSSIELFKYKKSIIGVLDYIKGMYNNVIRVDRLSNYNRDSIAYLHDSLKRDLPYYAVPTLDYNNTLGLSINGILLGCLTIRGTDAFNDDLGSSLRVGYLSGLHIPKLYRGIILSTHLINKALDYVKNDYDVICTTYIDDKELKFYTTKGFRVVDEFLLCKEL